MDHAAHSHPSPSFFNTILLVLLALSVLPLTTILLFFSTLLHTLVPLPRLRRRLRSSPNFRSKTILIAGISTPQGLRLARAFYQCGHNVIGADFEADGIPLPVSFSRAIGKFYKLRSYNVHYGPALYMKDLVEAARKGRADLFVNCSNLIPAEENLVLGKMLSDKADCGFLSLEDDLLKHFSTRETSLRYVKSLGLPVPEVYQVRSRGDVHKILHESQGRKLYTLNAANTNGVARAKSFKRTLPRRTLSQTYNDLATIPITTESPWVLEQHFVLGEEYTTFAVIVEGHLKAFAAAHVSRLSGTSYRNVRADHGIGAAMRKFVETFVQRAGDGHGSGDFTTNLSMDFRVEERETGSGIEWSVLPIDVHVAVSPPVLLFSGTAGAIALTRAYMSVLAPSTNGLSTVTGEGALHNHREHVIVPKTAAGVYFMGQDLVDLVLRPAMQLVLFKMSLLQFVWRVVTFVEHVLLWREVGLEMWDMLPWYLMYHVYLPVKTLLGVWNRKVWE